jgi:hypothetical protein
MMIDLRAPATTGSPSQIRETLRRALSRGDRDAARRIFYSSVLPNHGFTRLEVEQLADRVGAIDEGDDYLASRTDL